jgi:ADP-ribose pyrophosphatase YjhB (NUDIX family)
VLKNLLYRVFKRLVGVCFNVLNLLLAGNLPPFGSVCVVVEDQGKYLVVERAEGSLVFPGGFMRWRENPVQSALRECEEETGLSVKVNGLIGCSSNTGEDFTRMSSLTIIYEAGVAGGELKRSIEGQPCWIDEAELRKRVYAKQRGVLDHFLHYREQKDHVKRVQA